MYHSKTNIQMSNFKHSLFRTLLYAQLFAGFSGAVAASQMDLSSASSPEVNQQGDKIITGKITDAKGEPIIGANVLVKGSTTGTITDIAGLVMIALIALYQHMMEKRERNTAITA